MGLPLRLPRGHAEAEVVGIAIPPVFGPSATDIFERTRRRGRGLRAAPQQREGLMPPGPAGAMAALGRRAVRRKRARDAAKTRFFSRSLARGSKRELELR